MINLIEATLENSYSYPAYRGAITKLLAEGKTSGATQNEDLVGYSKLNEVRMNRLDKTIKVSENHKKQLEALSQNYIWLVLSEGWCGDAAQIVPVLNKMSNTTSKIELKIAFRDENDLLMQEFLTDGSRSIPKMLLLHPETKAVIATWGPRPKGAKDLISNYKATHGVVDAPAKTELQKWYFENKGNQIITEILELLT